MRNRICSHTYIITTNENYTLTCLSVRLFDGHSSSKQVDEDGTWAWNDGEDIWHGNDPDTVRDKAFVDTLNELLQSGALAGEIV